MRVLRYIVLALSLIATTQADVLDVLLETSLEDLMNMKVTTASKYAEKANESPSTLVVVTAEDIRNRGYFSITEILQDLPGFDVIIMNGSFYMAPYVRGNRTEIADRVLLFINGQNFQSLGFQFMELNKGLLPVSSIERIEVLYGPASAIYGPDAFGGIINVITKSANELDGNALVTYTEAGGGTYDTGYGGLTALGKYEDLSIFLAGKFYKSDEPDFSDHPFLSDELIRNSWHPMRDLDAVANGYSDPSNDHSLFAKFAYKSLELGYSHMAFAEGNGPHYPADKTIPGTQWKEFRTLLYAKNSSDLSDKLNLTTTLSYKTGDTPPNSLWAQRYGNDSGGVGVELGYWHFYNQELRFSQDFVFSANERTVINGGFNLTNNDFQKGYQISWGDFVDDTASTYTYPLVQSRESGEPSRYKMYINGGYAQVKWKSRSEKLIIVPGLRYDHNSIFGGSTNPRIGLVYKFSNKITYKANYGSGFQFPSPRNLYGSWAGTTVNPALEPETITAYETGLIMPVSDKVWNEVSGYYNYIDNSNILGTNLPPRKTYGLEYKLKIRAGDLGKQLQDLRIYANYSYTRPLYDTDLSNEATGRSSNRVGSIASHKLNFGFGGTVANFLYVNSRNNYVSARETNVSNPIEKVDGFLLCNLSLQVRNLAEGITFQLNISNLFDSEYYHPGAVDAGAGEDTSSPSTTWYTSRLPQAGRQFLFVLKTDLGQ
jgi:outer membrane receptor for ferrienterochelin and colicins